MLSFKEVQEDRTGQDGQRVVCRIAASALDSDGRTALIWLAEHVWAR